MAAALRSRGFVVLAALRPQTFWSHGGAFATALKTFKGSSRVT